MLKLIDSTTTAAARRALWVLFWPLALAGCADHPASADAGRGSPHADASQSELDGGGTSSGNADAGAAGSGGHAGTSTGRDAAVDGSRPSTHVEPNNPWIAYTKIVDSFGQLYFVKADGSGQKPYKGPASEQDPAWSPDGTQLAFVQYQPGAGNSLHLLNMVTGEDRALDVSFGKLTRPRWSPDGKTLVVAATTASVTTPALFRVELATDALTQITESSNGDGGHDFGPDGTLFFVRNVDGTAFDIFRVPYDADPRTQPTRVTTGSKVLGGVSAHPSGKLLFYARAAASGSELVALTLAGSVVQVIGEPGDQEPRAFVRGDKLVLNRSSFGTGSEIAVVDNTGKLLVRCTNDSSFDTAPAPSPLDSSELDLSSF